MVPPPSTTEQSVKDQNPPQVDPRSGEQISKTYEGSDTTSIEQTKSPSQSETENKDDMAQARTKPSFVLPSLTGSASLHQRLQSFLPQMQQSNTELANGDVKNIEHVDENKEHIVMDLGLGVLEHQTDTDDSESSSGSDSEPSEDEAERDPMSTLLGKPGAKGKPEIQELS